MRINIVHKIPDAPSSPSREAVSALSEGVVVLTTKDELTRLRKEIEGVTDAKKKFELQRKIVRLERFDRLQEGESSPASEPIKKILQGKTVDTYLGSDLLSLKKRGIDILPLVFVANEGTDGKKTSQELTGGEKFTVNFGKNKYLNDDIGAGDILPRDIVYIKINGVEGARKDSPRPGYYAGGKYLPIFDGDVVEIMSKGALSTEEVLQAQTAQDKRWTFLRASDMIDSNNKNPLTDLEEDRALFSEIPKVIKEREAIKRKYNEELIGFTKITPGSEDCVSLFRDACREAHIDESWAANKSLHDILEKESGGYVGRLNYTLGDMSLSEFKDIALNGNRVPARSSASGLGQLLLGNVDKYYPSGRFGIGNPLEEAIGMVKYIQDRYGDPNTAMSVYGKIGHYTHAITGSRLSKTFQEGY